MFPSTILVKDSALIKKQAQPWNHKVQAMKGRKMFLGMIFGQWSGARVYPARRHACPGLRGALWGSSHQLDRCDLCRGSDGQAEVDDPSHTGGRTQLGNTGLIGRAITAAQLPTSLLTPDMI